MNHELIKRVVSDMHQLIRETKITDRDYLLERNANYILTGLRRCGKSTVLYKIAKDLIQEGNDWSQIFYINFEDDRLMGFKMADFDDLVETAHELTDQKIYYFFDEIQNIEGWERFARRMADYHERVYITGSNATMLSSEMAGRLGGRYISETIMPFSFAEELRYKEVPYTGEALYSSSSIGKIRGCCISYLQEGGLPESFGFMDKRVYIQSVFDKVLLGDITARKKVKNPEALRMMVKKTAETVMHETSYNRLAGNVKEAGLSFSTDAAIRYMGYCEEAYLLFHTSNFVSKFSEKESTPRFYFMDNGFLSLFLVDKNSALLENAVALYLYRNDRNDMYYFKSNETGIDIDFYLPEKGTAVQVCWQLNEESGNREIENLIRFSKSMKNIRRCMIVTNEDKQTIKKNGITIEVIPLYQFLLSGCLS